MENQHRKIKGYKELSQEQIDLMNEYKVKEAELADLINRTNNLLSQPKGGGIDERTENLKLHGESMRQLALARTHIEQGIMHGIKAIAQPDSPWLNR